MKLLPGTLRLGFISSVALLVLLFSLLSANAASTQNPSNALEEEIATVQNKPATGDAANLLMQLNLTPEQIEQMKEIRRQSGAEVQALTQRRKQARRALDEALYTNALDDAAIDQRTRELAEAQAALVRLEAQTQLRVRHVLTPEQLEMFRNLRQQAQRQQRIQRRLERRGDTQALPRNRVNRRLGQRPDSVMRKTGDALPNTSTSTPKEARSTLPAERRRDSRPFAFPRPRRRRP